MSELLVVPSHEIRIKEYEEARNEIRSIVNNLNKTYTKHRGKFPGLFRSVYFYTDHLGAISREIDSKIKELWEEYDQLKSGVVQEKDSMSLRQRLKPIAAFILTLTGISYLWNLKIRSVTTSMEK